MKYLVIGLGICGKATARFLLSKNFQVDAVDKNKDLILSDPAITELLSNGLTLFNENDSFDLSLYDQIVLSPGIPFDHPLCIQARHLGLEMIGEVELACRNILSKMIGITGTNGKTTVTLLITHILNFCGKQAKALGNIGTPLTEEILIQDSKSLIVAELSSFQLDTLESKVLDAAVILNVTPDHLERYKTMENYTLSKMGISKNLKVGAPLYVFEAIPEEFPSQVKGYSYFTYGYRSSNTLWTDLHYLKNGSQILFSLPKNLSGRRSHDLENFMGAYALCSHLDVTQDQFLKGYETFKKPHHRIEYVKTVNDVDYYDDSKGTNIDAVIRAIESLESKIVLIAGGVDKGAPYSPWINAFKGKVKCIYAIGQAAPTMEAQLSEHFAFKRFSTLEEAVLEASQIAVKGDKVLLSPGCSSFDMFRDYTHRGQEFQRLVNQLVCQELPHE